MPTIDLKQGIRLGQIPMAPSENEMYATDFRTGRRFESKELFSYKERMAQWAKRREAEIQEIKHAITWELADHRIAIQVDTFMHFQYESLFTKPVNKTERPRRKRMDPHNKCKALYDALTTILGIDDCRMIAGPVVPVLRTLGEGQFVEVQISIRRILTDEEMIDN